MNDKVEKMLLDKKLDALKVRVDTLKKELTTLREAFDAANLSLISLSIVMDKVKRRIDFYEEEDDQQKIS